MLTPRENALKAYRHEVPEWVPCFFTDFSLIQAYPQGEKYCGNTHGPDWFGIDWTYEPGVKAPIPTPGIITFDDITDWEKYVQFPDLNAIDWNKQADIDVHTDFLAIINGEGIIPLKDGASHYDGDKLRVCMVLNGMFERMHAFMGFENALIALATEPEACEAYFSAVADFKIKYFEKIGKYYNVDVINAHDDYGTNDRLFMAPQTWRKIVKPHLKRMIDACHDMGIIYQHHSCGHIEPLIEDFIEIGMDAIDPMQALANPNLGELKKKYGNRITFCGGFNNQHVLEREGVTPDEIKEEYRRAIDTLAVDGSYVIYPITAGFDYVPPFLEEHFRYGTSFYSKK